MRRVTEQQIVERADRYLRRRARRIFLLKALAVLATAAGLWWLLAR